ncbi:MAG: hypothetical protein WBP85_03250 [Terracidiphilus sp.]
MKDKLSVLAGTFVLGVLGFCITQPATAQSTTAPTPFVVTVPINYNNFNFTAVPIPAGKRLQIDYISMSGAAQTTGAYVQPIIILAATLQGGSQNLFYFAPLQDPNVPGQYYDHEQTTIYVDTLYASPAFAGYTPSFMSFNLVISGHLYAAPTAVP